MSEPIQDRAVRAMAAMAFVRGISVGKSFADAAAAGFKGTLIGWAKLRGQLTDEELAEAGRAYVRTWNDVPLATKKRRVEALSTLFDTLTARLRKIEATERAGRKAAKAATTPHSVKGDTKGDGGLSGLSAKSVSFHSAEWVRVAAEIRATLRDIALEMDKGGLPGALEKMRDGALLVPETLRELQALLDMEVARLKAAADREVATDSLTAVGAPPEDPGDLTAAEVEAISGPCEDEDGEK